MIPPPAAPKPNDDIEDVFKTKQQLEDKLKYLKETLEKLEDRQTENKKLTEQLHALKQNAHPELKLSEGSAIFLATLTGYVLTYVYMACYSVHFKIPITMVNHSAGALVTVGIISVGLLFIPLALITLDLMITTTISPKHLAIYKPLRSVLITYIPLIAILWINHEHNKSWFYFILLLLPPFLSYLTKRQNKALQRLKPPKSMDIEEPLNHSAKVNQYAKHRIDQQEIFNTYRPVLSSQFFLAIVYLMILTLAIGTLGSKRARKRTDFAMLLNPQPRLLIDQYGTTAIFADYDTTNGVIKLSWTVVDINNLPGPLTVTNFSKPPRIESPVISKDPQMSAPKSDTPTQKDKPL